MAIPAERGSASQRMVVIGQDVPGGMAARLRSAPLLVKILGIGLVVAGLFGATTLIHMQQDVSTSLVEGRERAFRAYSLGIAAALERPLLSGDLIELDRALDRLLDDDPSLRYALARDHRGRLLAQAVGDGLQAVPAWLADGEERVFRQHGESAGTLRDAQIAIAGGRAGYVQIGQFDTSIVETMQRLGAELLLVLGLCMVLGFGLAFVLATMIAEPVRHLMRAARSLADGERGVRAQVVAADEIGALALAFNDMAAALEGQEEALREAGRERQTLFEHLVQAQDQERAELAREVHDHVGQGLLALLMAIEGGDIGSAARRQQLIEQLRTLIGDARRLAWDLHPAVLEDHGLGAALERLAERMRGDDGPAISVSDPTGDAGARLPRGIERALYRIAQEALSNAVRHAKAKRIDLLLIRRPATITLLVEDDGVGFDQQQDPDGSRPHLGLSGMRERAALFEGRLTIESEPGHGCCVRVAFPLGEQS